MTDTPAPPLWQSAAIGLVAGLVASFAMDRFQAAVTALSESDGEEDGEPATQQAADALARAATGLPVPDGDKPAAGEALHYALGAALGLGYTLLARRQPVATAGFGGVFGAAAAVLLDEIAVPAAGLAEAPWKIPVSTHLYGLASHLVFGAATEATRRALAAALPARA